MTLAETIQVAQAADDKYSATLRAHRRYRWADNSDVAEIQQAFRVKEKADKAMRDAFKANRAKGK